jgi:UDP-N-acetylglucosamine 2-epimerase (non-hydrolysing)
MRRILESLLAVSDDLVILFPIHPRTRHRIAEFGFNVGQLRLLDPLPYIEFIALQRCAAVVVRIPGVFKRKQHIFRSLAVTLRENTERPIQSPKARTFWKGTT